MLSIQNYIGTNVIKQENLSKKAFMQCIVLIPCHVNHSAREETLREALISLNNNSKLPDHVYISISGEFKDKEALVKNLKFHVTPTYHAERKLQFAHIEYLTKYVKPADIVMFLDDDDLYHSDKIRLVHEYFLQNSTKKLCSHRHVQFGHFDAPLTSRNVKDITFTSACGIEYYDLCMRGCKLLDWFQHMNKYILNMTFADVLDMYKGVTDLAFLASFELCDPFTELPLLYQRKEVIPREYDISRSSNLSKT